MYRTWRELEKSQWQSPEALSALQKHKLSALLEHCRNNVPFYRKLFDDARIAGCEPDPLSALERVPCLTKETITAHFQNLRARGMPERDIRKNSTSGSTGESLFFLQDVSRARGMSREAARFRFFRWCGIRPFDRWAYLWGAPFDAPSGAAGGVRFWKRPVLFLSSYDLSEGAMAGYAQRLKEFRPALLTSYPSPLECFASFCRDNSITIPSLRAIICSAEQLFDHQRELAEEAFRVPVFNRYGCREFSGIAQECEKRRGMHICSERVYVEAVRDDGTRCAPGETGELVITDLDNYAMPFIRYRTGDLGSLSQRQCPCGRGLPMLETLEGRVFDVIRTPSGKTVSGTFWTLLTRHISEDIRAFQVRQESPGQAALLLQMRTRQLSPEQERELREKIRQAAPDLDLRLEYVDRIPLTRSGKRRFVIGPGA